MKTLIENRSNIDRQVTTWTEHMPAFSPHSIQKRKILTGVVHLRSGSVIRRTVFLM
jgi:hypothetical protein